jgi:hypothetical protein
VPEKVHEIYRDGQLISTDIIEISDAEAEHDRAPAQLRQAVARLGQIATQADEVAGQGPNVSQAQIKGLFTAVADEARLLRRLIIYVGRQVIGEALDEATP